MAAKRRTKRKTMKRAAADTAVLKKGAPGRPDIIRKRSRLHGWGVFAKEAINKNKRIIDYAGEKITRKESDRRSSRQLARGNIWVFELNRAWARDAEVNGNVARYINHSCTPNCYVEIAGDMIWIRAARNIRAGEELTYNYNTTGDKTMNCRCRPGCPNMI